MRDHSSYSWQLDLYIGLTGLTPLALLYLSLWALGGYS